MTKENIIKLFEIVFLIEMLIVALTIVYLTLQHCIEITGVI
jgi:hypothetical protein